MRIEIAKLIDYLLWSVLIIIPSIVSFFDIQNLFSPFKFPILLIFTGIIFSLLVLHRSLKFDFTTIIALILITLFFLSSIFALNNELAFIGYYNGYGRYEGFVSLLAYLILWFSAKNYLVVSEKRIKGFFLGLIPFSIYALIQYYGLDPLVIHYGFVPRIFSTIGNPNFVGSLAVMLVVLSTSLFVLKKRWVYFFFAMLFFSTLVVCQTRSAWVAGTIVITVFLFYQLIIKKNFLFPSYLVLGYVLICLFLFNTQKDNSVIQKSKTITKELSLTNEYGGSGRLKIWSITQKILVEHPWLGVGPENLKLAIKSEQPKLHNEYYKRTGTTIDKAHNEYLHLAVTCGIPALCVYLFLLFLSLKSSWNSYLKSPWALAVGLMIIAYLIQAFFNISVLAVAPVFWIFLGGLAGNRFISQELMNESDQKHQIEIVK